MSQNYLGYCYFRFPWHILNDTKHCFASFLTIRHKSYDFYPPYLRLHSHGKNTRFTRLAHILQVCIQFCIWVSLQERPKYKPVFRARCVFCCKKKREANTNLLSIDDVTNVSMTSLTYFPSMTSLTCFPSMTWGRFSWHASTSSSVV